MAEEKLININLRQKIVEKPCWKRKQVLPRMIRRFLQKHAKGEVKINPKLNQKIAKGEKIFRIKLLKKENFTEALPA